MLRRHKQALSQIKSARKQLRDARTKYEKTKQALAKAQKEVAAAKYQVPLKRGIPAIAVLDGDGKLLFSQKNGEFESARTLSSEDVLKFLNRWKSPSRAPGNH